MGIVLGLGGAYVLGALVPFWCQSTPAGGAAFFPPAGLTLVALLMTPRRTWPIWLGVFAVAEFGVDVSQHEPVAMAAGFSLANTLEPIVGALLLVAALGHAKGFRDALASFTFFGAMVAPVAGALVGATFAVAFSPAGRGWWATAATWWVGDALGVVIIGGALLSWARVSPWEDRASLAATAAMSGLAAGAIVGSAVLWHHPLVIAVLPVLVWGAFAGGPRAVGVVGIATAAAAQWAVASGRADRWWSASSAQHQLIVVQAYLAISVLTGAVLCVEVAERHRSEYVARRAERDRARSEEMAVKAAEAERHSLTQETHDLVGHGLTAVLLQLGAARRVVASDPGLACELLASAEEMGRRACGELDAALRRLGHEPPLQPARGIEGIAELVGALSKAGLRVTLDMPGERDSVPTLVDWSAYRIAQEALTNVARHAPAAQATVTVRVDHRALHLSVIDDGEPVDGTASHTEGRGIIGMRERAAALGGTLEAWPRDGHGFAVVATLPL
jgi:signal transduction histidine kinase